MQVCLFLHSEGWAKMIVVIASMLQTLNIEHNLFWTQNIPLMTDWHFLPHASVLKHVPVRLAYARVWSLTPFPLLSFHEQVALVFPNNDPAAFMVAFYGCLLAEVVPVPIEVPLTRKVRL